MSFWRSLFGGGTRAKSGVSVMAGATDVGCKRSQNQDSWGYGVAAGLVNITSNAPAPEPYEGVLPVPGWVAVADGMGGAKGGDVASRRALEIVGEALSSAAAAAESEQGALQHMQTSLRTAHTTLDAEAAADETLRGMGCTFSVLWWPQPESRRAVLGQVGDSRIYLWRARKLKQITRDQTVVQRLMDEGSMTAEEAKRAKFSSVLEYALGAGGGDLEPEIRWVDFVPGDVVLICSDGLSGEVNEEELTRLLPPSGSAQLIPHAQKLIKAARKSGGPDNITAVLISIH